MELDRDPRETIEESARCLLVKLPAAVPLPQHVSQFSPEEVRSQKLILR
jgi:hypothetical protein